MALTHSHLLTTPTGNSCHAAHTDYAELPSFVTEGIDVHFVKEYPEIYSIIFPPEEKEERGQ